MAKYNNSRFYWLQLKEDFFDEDAIDWLEDQPNGKEYSLFYLKLCLKSLRTNGVLIRRVGNLLVPYDHIKLGELTKTNPDTVLVAMELLLKIGLVKKLENGELYITQVENMIGSQSIGAFKKQQQRISKSSLLIENTKEGQKGDICPPDIDIDKELDIDIDKDKENNKKKTSRFTPPTLTDVQDYCKERNNNVDAQRFIDYYTSNGWKVGKNSMKDWKAAVRTWERQNFRETTKPKQEQNLDFDRIHGTVL